MSARAERPALTSRTTSLHDYALFRHGIEPDGQVPEYLVDHFGLRAGPQPRELRLAQAYCTEGCCGALYVTVRRDGDEAVWGGWRGVDVKGRPLRLYFDWRLPNDGSPPEERAAAALQRIERSDPKDFARLQRGSSELAAALGSTWADGDDQDP
ncbi:hypothetical protein [Streptomyces sp. NPDC058874]|uniref:hypothetical protein n=1 Tax=unclassified Streptomyces TaxID=2593676 RepID=UPI003676B17E